MVLSDIIIKLSNIVSVMQLKNNEWELETQAFFTKTSRIKVYLIKEGNSWFLTDKKETLKFMNDIYDLKALDVKNCILGVLKTYGFTISSGALKGEITSEKTIAKSFFDFIMCSSQLANMHIFFNKPE